MPQINISEKATKQLSELSEKRKSEGAIISSKKSINEQLIDDAFKKEFDTVEN